ncbi:MAG: deoxyhypusine synthase family protein [Phycisphaerales bacterium JB040]
MSLRAFLEEHFRHYNARTLVEAAQAYDAHLRDGGRMMVTLAGAMSTAELGRSLAEMIRRGKVHAISCTGANLEEDVFRLVAADHYVRIPNWRELSPADEVDLLNRHLNRVTDTCIPEEEAFRKLEKHLVRLWTQAERDGKRHFPHEFFYQLLLSGDLAKDYQADPKHSWLLAAAEADLPIYTPGWEDSTCGNFAAARVIDGTMKTNAMIRSGLEAMQHLAEWYTDTSRDASIGFFQIGGGIAGDFPICSVPMMRQDLRRDVPLWGYFCQISDSTTSYGSYSGAVPNEKITWEKIGPDTPRFIIESDATIVAPLVFGWLLDW